MAGFFQVHGVIFFGILALIAAIFVLMVIGAVVQMWTERRYRTIWHELHPKGHYTVLKVVWNDGSRIGLLLHYNEPDASGHALYACGITDLWSLPCEGDRLVPKKHGWGMPPFEIIKKERVVTS